MPLYLIGLCISILGLFIIDWRYKLAFFYDKRRTIITLLIGISLFIIWDLLGIAFNIFFIGESTLLLPIRLLPEFPLEEIFFLTLLVYVTLIIYRYASLWGSRR